jgi:tetratricopeptide (TPR) repeat protein
VSLWLVAILAMAAPQQPIPQVLNATPGETSLEFYEGLDSPVFDRAQELFLESRYEEASETFLKLYETTSHPVALFLAGNGLYRLDRVDEAISHYTRAVREGLEGMPDIHYNLANAYYAKYMKDEAIAEFRQVLALTGGTDAMAHYHLGILLDGEGEHAESIEHYRRTVELTDDGEPMARQHLGVAHFMNRDYDDSVRELEVYIGMVPEDAGGYLNLGIALRYAGKLMQAITQLQRALTESSDQLPAAHYQLALIHSDREEYGLSLEHFEAAIQQGHTSPKIQEEYAAVRRRVP